MTKLRILPCMDSEEIALNHQRDLLMSRTHAVHLGVTAVETAIKGVASLPSGETTTFRDDVIRACKEARSIPPGQELPVSTREPFAETLIQVTNDTTLRAAKQLTDRGLRPLALNFANGVTPGGGFLHGSRAQEESLCRSSALYLTLKGDPMYQAHAARDDHDSSDWAILSPDVPVFRDDAGNTLEKSWNLGFLTCAAPVRSETGDQQRAWDLLEKRIHRVLSIARAYGYDTLVLGAWGCGAFGNDPVRTARDFRAAIEDDFRGAFSEIVFAITDWSPERRFLGPFRDAFSE